MQIIDQETSWTEEYFTPLDAQVESGSGRKLVNKVEDLIAAISPPKWWHIRKKRPRIFLVLGDPGSGKSVALRKLATDLLHDIKASDRIPIYINLKEWKASAVWSEDNPPTLDDFVQFVIQYMKDQSDVLSKKFLDVHFERLLSSGRFFFILDSFDEIPQVLDSDEHSWLIRELSNIIVKFFDSSLQMEGVVGSREFKKPRLPNGVHRVLKIVPFREDKIREAFSKKQFCDERLVRQMFRERLDLVALSRNPFTAAMIADYIIALRRLPQNQGEIFLHYISDRLQASRERMTKHGLTRQDVEQGAIAIALAMFATPRTGLEATTQELQAGLPTVRVAEIADVLTFGRIGRYGPPGRDGRFSFIHRRFHEYFLVQGLLVGKAPINIGAIPTDSRWRDALVLYCALARQEETIQIAEYCWTFASRLAIIEIDPEGGNPDNDTTTYLSSVHCLRFLSEAFRYRRELLGDYQAPLAELILQNISRGSDMLIAKISVEAVGLVEDANVERAVQTALELDNAWIGETALKACRHLPTITSRTRAGLARYLMSISTWEFLKRYRELRFSLGLSDAFRQILTLVKMRRTSLLLTLVAIAINFAYAPLSLLELMAGVVFFNAFAEAAKYLSLSQDSFSAKLLKFLQSPGRTIESPIMRLCLTLQSSVLTVRYGRILYENTLSSPHKLGSDSLNLSFVAVSVFCALPWATIWQFAQVIRLPHGPLLKLMKRFQYIVRIISISQFVNVVRRMTAKDALALLSVIFLSILGTFGVVFAIKWLTDRFGAFFEYIAGLAPYIMTVLAVCTVLGVLGLLTFTWRRDRYLYTHSNFGDRAQRSEIDAVFRRFATNYWRRRFIEDLRERQVELFGAWPNGKIPNVDNDISSILLAQWEELNHRLN
jgi:hypothetical protein